MGVQWIDFKGKKILYGNFQGVKTDEEAMKILEQEMAIISKAVEPVLLLVNLQDARMTAGSSEYTKEQMAKHHAKIKKIGLVGVSGLKTIIVQGIGRETGEAPQGMFATVDEAKEWLIS